MKTWLIAGIGLMALSGCSGGSSDAVGENSAGSIKTTAVGEVVATPSPTATPTADAGMTSNDTDATADTASDNAAAE
ncbi:hypothetical protein FPZ24_11255 [Sphingomonas panacisoli]|uniref:Entericidin EcnAB n=1 Tax=Sphingomonas panacisoli TaxID=1813879 RepID=A0A5B8LJE8_9SPHN|nr:hypothetical protein [Sphingomonas panacisoli]QDZ07989.1 hypothetical protein FPZ24_11255 [Sphingomonas panacisoli]